MENNKKKTNINLILGIILLLASTVLGGEIYLLLTRDSGTTKSTPTSSSAPVADDDEDEDNDSADDVAKQKANTKLSADLVSVATVLDNYQANNRGKIPIGVGEGKTTWTYFERWYLRLDDYYAGYKFVFCDSFGTGGCKDSTKLTWEKDQNTIYISAQAVCEDGVVKKSTTGTKNVAIYSVGQKNSKDKVEPVYCKDNVGAKHNKD